MPYFTSDPHTLFYSWNRIKRGATLILVHGAGGRHIDWPKELRHSRLYSVYSIDLPGHFKASQSPPCQSIEEMAHIITQFVEDQKLNNVVVAGHSMGGLVAQSLGVQAPAWLSGLILMGTTSKMPVTPVILDNIHTDLDTVGDFITKYAFSKLTRGLIKGAVRKVIMESDPEVLFADFSACNQFADSTEQLNQITAKTFIVAGKRDKFTPLAQSKHLDEHIPDSKLSVMDAAGHYMFIEQPLQTTRLVNSFMKSF